MRTLTRALPALLLCCLPFAACGDGPSGLPEGQEAFTGTVLNIDDEVAVDGPVELELEGPSGERLIAYLHFFRAEPPPPGSWEIYERIQALEPGDRVRVIGVREGERLEIRGLRELTVPP